MAYPDNKDIRETGPQSNKTITELNEGKFGTIDDRKKWLFDNYEGLQAYGYSTKIKHKKFEDPQVERAFRNQMFYNRFKDLSPDISTQFNDLDKSQWDELYRRYPSAEDFLYDYRSKQGVKKMLEETSAKIPQGEAFLQTLQKQSVLDQVTDIQSPSFTGAELKLQNATRYLNPDGTERIDQKNHEQQVLQNIAPDLSSHYKEMINNNNDYLKFEDIDWSAITPSVMNHLEKGDIDAASQVFNNYLQDIMWEHQNTGERVLNYGTRFVANVGLMVPQIAGSVGGLFESIYDVGKGVVSGEGVEWDKAAAKILYDNYLGNWADNLSESLREAMPLYNDDLWLDPESMSFMASMFIPNLGAAKLLKGVSTVGKGAKATKWANTANKLTGYQRSLNKAGKDIEKVLGDSGNKYFNKLYNIEMEELANGKSLAEIRQLQQEALANIYQTGTISRSQIALSTMLEGQEEARGAKKAVMGEFDQRWQKDEAFTREQILNGTIDVSDQSYSIDALDGYINELNKTSQERFNLYKQNNQDIPDKYIWDQVQKDIYDEALLRAKSDTYIEQKKADYYDYADSQAAVAGSIVALENFIILGATEPFGGWTTKAPMFKTARSLATESKSFGNKLKNAWSNVRSMNSGINKINAQMVFDEATGRFVKKGSLKSVGQKVWNVGKVLTIENLQEVLQEGATAGVEGAAENNALDFILNHNSGEGASYTQDNYNSYWTSFINNFYHGRSTQDILKIIRNTSAQMITGTPSISKYFGYKSPTLRENANLIEKAVNAANNWLPINSPVLQAFAENANASTDARTFVNLYNRILSESEYLEPSLRYGSASMNYAARSYNAAAEGNQTSYEDNLQSARLAEAIFLAQLRGNKNQARIAYYENLRDINKKREGENEEQFKERQANTLKQLREDSPYNSLKNASDEELINWAESNGRIMMNLTQKMATKTAQLYEQYDGNIAWEQLYGLLYSDAISEYSREQLAGDNKILDQAKEGLTDTQLTDEEKEKGILTESQILAQNPIDRQNFLNLYNNSKGKQKEIIESLLTQLTATATKKGIDNKIEDLFNRMSTRQATIDENSKIFNTILRNPESFLNQLSSRKLRRVLKDSLRDILDVLDNKDNYDTNNKLTVAARQKLSDKITILESSLNDSTLPQKEGESNEEYENRVRQLKTLKDALEKSGMLRTPKGQIIKAINSLLSIQKDAYWDVKNADDLNIKLEELVSKHLKEFNPAEQDEILILKDFIQDTLHIAFTEYDRVKDAARPYNYQTDGQEISYSDLAQKWLPKFNEWYTQSIEEEKRNRLEDTTNPKVSDATHTTNAGGTDNNKSKEQSLQEEINGYKNSIRKSIQEITSMNIKIEDDINKQLQDILNKQYESLEDILLDLSEIDKKGDKDTKKIIQHIVKSLTKVDTEATEVEPEPVGDIISLADINKWLFNTNLRNTVYADYMRDRNLQNLLRSGKIKEGTEVFVLYDNEFANRVLDGWKSSMGVTPFTQAQVPFIALIKGSVEGYDGSTITIGEDIYTPISLFRAYGKGKHNSRQIVSSLVSNLTGFAYNENQEFTPSLYETQILKDSKGNPIKFTIDHIEAGRDETTGNSVIHFSENIQKDFQEEDKVQATEEETKSRAKKWFLSRLFIDEEHTTETGKHPIPKLKVENPKSKKSYNAPIFVRKISETKWNNTTVSEAIKNGDTRILLDNVGNPMLNRVADMFKKFMSFDDVKKIIKDFQNGKTENLNGLSKWLNGRGDALGHRLSLPAGYKYYAAYRHDGNTNIDYIDIGYGTSRSDDASANNATIADKIKDNVFISLEVPRIDEASTIQAPTTQIVTDEMLIEALKKLLFTADNQMKTWGKEEFIKWNFDYDDVRNHDGIADQILSELYDTDVFVIQENSPLMVHLNAVEAQAQLQVKPEDETAEEVNSNIDPDTGVTLDNSKVESKKTDRTNAEVRAGMLELKPIDKTRFAEHKQASPDTIEGYAQRFKWVGENRVLKLSEDKEVEIKFIGIDESNNLVILLKDEDLNPENTISIKEAFTDKGMPNLNNIQFIKYSEVIAPTEETRSEVEENPEDMTVHNNPEDSIEFEDFTTLGQTDNTEQKSSAKEFTEEDFLQALDENFSISLAMIGANDAESMKNIAENAKKKYGSYEEAINHLYRITDTEDLEHELECLM